MFWEIKQATWIEIKRGFNYLKVNWEKPMIILKWGYYRIQCRVNSEISCSKTSTAGFNNRNNESEMNKTLRRKII